MNQGESVATFWKEEQNPVWTSGYLNMSTLLATMPVSGRKEAQGTALGPGNQQKDSDSEKNEVTGENCHIVGSWQGAEQTCTVRTATALCPHRWLPSGSRTLWPAALCDSHDLLSLTRLAVWPISFVQNYFLTLAGYCMPSTAFVNLDMKKEKKKTL